MFQALDEPSFSEAYAQMCQALSTREVKPDPNADPTGANAVVKFRTLLLSNCQKEFYRNYMDDLDTEGHEKAVAAAKTEEEKKTLRDAFAAQERKARMRSLGNIRSVLCQLLLFHDICFLVA